MLYDEARNKILEGTWTSVDKDHELRHDAFCCSKCLKMFFRDYTNIYKSVVVHSKKCNGYLQDGISIITKERLTKKISQIVDFLGFISKREQEIDFPMTDQYSIKKLNQIVFIYVMDRKPLGMLTTDNRNLIDESDTKKRWISVSDFVVINYTQRHGIGKKLFDGMLEYYNKKPSELAYCQPSYATQQFLSKWYGLKEAHMW